MQLWERNSPTTTLVKAESEAVRSGNKAYSEHQRTESAVSQIQEMLAILEIKELWENIQQNKKAFLRQIDKWIEDGVAAIRDYAVGKDNDFQAEQGWWRTYSLPLAAEVCRYRRRWLQ